MANSDRNYDDPTTSQQIRWDKIIEHVLDCDKTPSNASIAKAIGEPYSTIARDMKNPAFKKHYNEALHDHYDARTTHKALAIVDKAMDDGDRVMARWHLEQIGYYESGTGKNAPERLAEYLRQTADALDNTGENDGSERERNGDEE